MFARDPLSPKQRYFGLGLALWAFITIWSFATPPFAGPDEAAHIVRTEALAHSDLVGKKIDGQSVLTEVPAPFWAAEGFEEGCWSTKADVPVSCRLSDDTSLVSTKTYVGRYNPAFYILASLPARVIETSNALYALRLVGGLLCAALIAGAFASLEQAGLSTRAILLSLLPTAIFLASVVNPSGLEVAAALAFCASGLALSRRPTTSTEVFCAISLLALCSARGLGLGFGVIIALAVFISTGSAPLWHQGCSKLARVIALAGIVTSAAWLAIVGGTEVLGVTPKLGPNRINIIKSGPSITKRVLLEAAGSFQWLEAHLPLLATYALLAILSTVCARLALAQSKPQRLSIGLLTLSFILIPILALTLKGKELGFFWQGRYSLPLIVAAIVLATSHQHHTRWIDNLSWLSFVGFNALSLWVVMRRNLVGANGPWLFTDSSAGWNLPLTAPILELGAIGLLVIIGGLTPRASKLANDEQPTT